MQCLFVAWRKFYCISVGQSNGGGGGGDDDDDDEQFCFFAFFFFSFFYFYLFFFPALSSDKLAINWPGGKTFLLIKAEAI